MFNQSQEGNNMSVMPLDVLGRTCVILLDSASHILQKGLDNLLKVQRDGN